MRGIVFLVCAVLAAACSPSSPSSPEPGPPQSSLTSSPVSACLNEAAVVADESLVTGNPGSGDVDGDGVADSVSVHFDPEGEPGCQAFVVAESEEGLLAGALETWRSDFGLPAPTLSTLQEMDGDPGLEVVVNMGAGASAQFVGIVKASGDALEQVVPDAGDNAVGEGLLGFGGSVGHLEAVDCFDGGIVSSFAAPDGRSYRVERRFLVFEGTRLVEDRVEVERSPLEEIERFPEYRASPFGSCSG